MATMKLVPVVLSFLCACVISDSDESLDYSQAQQPLYCSDWMCQTNSPLVDNYGFHDLHMKGQANDAGLSISRFDLYGQPMSLSVVGGRLMGRKLDGTVLQGNQLQFATIRLALNGTSKYLLRIISYSEAPMWAGGQQVWVPTYLLQWTIIGTTRWTNVCPLPDKAMGMQAYHSVLFEGDRIHADSKTIEPLADRYWFNIGCASSTLSKMFLTGHTHASARWGFTTTVDQRQTMLKMLSGDYCGKGKAYTVAGTPLEWKDDLGWMKYIDPLSKLEARWTKDGAKCLNVPRIEASQYPAGLAVFPDVSAAIEAECRIPSCDDAPPGDEFMGFHLLSANPL